LIEYAYLDTLKNFVSDRGDNLVSKIRSGFTKVYKMMPTLTEVNAWENSLSKLQQILKLLPPELDNVRIFIELRMPFSSARADVLLLGKKNGSFAGLIIELKQWSDTSIDCRNNGVYVLGREELNPYLQAESYAFYLKDYITVLHDAEIRYAAYLPNLKNVNLLKQYGNELIFGQDSNDKLANFILDIIELGLTSHELDTFLTSSYSPSKTIINQVVRAIKNEKSWILLDEQKLVFEKVRKIFDDTQENRKTVLIIEGGPGTGKSAIAIQLLAYALEKGLSAVHITNSSAFTTTMKAILIKSGQFRKNRVNGLFKLSHNFIKVPHNSLNLAICDEAHRFRKSTNLYPYLISNESQIYQIIKAAKVSIFFIDENQIVRPGEDGTKTHIIIQAERNKARIYEYRLNVQFRNAGNENFVKWLDYMLGIESKPIDTAMWLKDFEFKIFDNIWDMERELTSKIACNYSARLVAGFCWPWNDPDPQGNLPLDVVIGNWKKPWNRKRPQGRMTRIEEDPYYEWATRIYNQLDEVGCIYSSQGFEFDYIGVIWGEDLVFKHGWIAQPYKSYDRLIRGKTLKKF